MNGGIFPDSVNPDLVGTYPAYTKSGGGYVWDEVLEYRVWCHPERGASDEGEGSDYFYAFATYVEALLFSKEAAGTEHPVVLILQREFLRDTESGEYEHVKEERITEWQVEWLRRPKRTEHTIPDFLLPSAPTNRLDVLRGLAQPI